MAGPFALNAPPRTSTPLSATPAYRDDVFQLRLTCCPHFCEQGCQPANHFLPVQCRISFSSDAVDFCDRPTAQQLATEVQRAASSTLRPPMPLGFGVLNDDHLAPFQRNASFSVACEAVVPADPTAQQLRADEQVTPNSPFSAPWPPPGLGTVCLNHFLPLKRRITLSSSLVDGSLVTWPAKPAAQQFTAEAHARPLSSLNEPGAVPPGLGTAAVSHFLPFQCSISLRRVGWPFALM